MAVPTDTLNIIDGMSVKELTDFIEDRKTRADALLQDASDLEREANLARRTASDCISELAYARFNLRRKEG